ncbi:MAG: hypothetical protein U9R79_07455 [Armatimonadota bacterium]|nr:hypothetical protein [Armatimonadota bacterium]
MIVRVCAAIVCVAGAAAAQDVEIVTEPRPVELQSQREWTVGPVPTEGRTALLELTARTDAPTPSGSTFMLGLLVNGERVTAAKTRRLSRLRNKPLSFQHSPELTLRWARSGQWRIVYAPDFEVCNDQPRYQGEAYRFVLDITDLLSAEAENTVTARHIGTPALAARVEGDIPLIIGMMRLRTEQGESPMLRAADVMSQPINRGEPLAGPAEYEFDAFNTGGFEITVGGTGYPVETLVSYPGGGFNRLEARPEATAEGQPQWHTSLRAGQDPLIVGRGPDYELRRSVSLADGRIEVADTWVNLREAELGLIVDNRVLLDSDRRIHLAGSPDPSRESYYAPANPTVYVAGEGHGLGMVCEDDVYRNQATLLYDADENAAAMRTEMLWLPEGGEYTLRWSVYPVASEDYFDFINAVRDDWGSDYACPGPWGFFSPDSVIETPLEELREQLDRQKLDYLIYCGGWVDRLKDTKQQKTIGFGTYVLDEDWADFRRRLRLAIDKLHQARPGVTCLVYYDTQRDSYPDADRRYPDSRLVNAGGQQLSTEWGGRYSLTWNMVATLENSFGTAMVDAVDEYFEQMNVDGLYWDEMENVAFGSPLVTHNTHDGYSCVLDPETHEIDHRVGVTTLLGREHRIAVVERARELGGMVMGNGPTAVRALLAMQVPRMVEIQHNDVWCYEGNLDTPLGYLSSYLSFDKFVRAINLASLPVATHWSLYDHQVQPHLFPFTPIEIHPGYMLGEERIIVTHSGSYGWHGERALARVMHFDAEGMLTDLDFPTRVGEEARVEVEIGEGRMVILERLPVTLTPSAGEAVVTNLSWSEDRLSMVIESEQGATLNIKTRELNVPPGVQTVTFDM